MNEEIEFSLRSLKLFQKFISQANIKCSQLFLLNFMALYKFLNLCFIN